MKKTLLIIALFIGLGNVNAQDATNDATWEETIGFIQKYQYSLRINGWICENDLACKIENSIIQGYKWTFKYSNIYVTIDLSKLSGVRAYGKVKDDKYTKVDTSKLSEVRVLENLDHFTLDFTSKVVENIFYRDSNSDEVSQFYSSESFIIYDSELQTRMFKAFLHLAYLATEKRIAETKASGDKF